METDQINVQQLLVCLFAACRTSYVARSTRTHGVVSYIGLLVVNAERVEW